MIKKQCKQGSIHEPTLFLSSFTSSTDVSQFKPIRKVHPDDLIQILLKPVQALHIKPYPERFQGWLTAEGMAHSAALPTLDRAPRSSRRDPGARIAPGIVRCNFEKASQSSQQQGESLV